jgi:hypothetical protein
MPNIERVGKPPSLIFPPKTNPKNRKSNYFPFFFLKLSLMLPSYATLQACVCFELKMHQSHQLILLSLNIKLDLRARNDGLNNYYTVDLLLNSAVCKFIQHIVRTR